jgi:hypothetical protein
MSELAIHHQQHIRHKMRLGTNLVKWHFVFATSSKEPSKSTGRIELVVVRMWLQLS